MRLGLTFAIASLLLSACAFGNKHDYHSSVPTLEASTAVGVAVGTMDQREEVASGRRGYDFVGLQLGGTGVPFGVTTLSGKALASDVTGTIINGLGRKGITATSIDLPPDILREEAVRSIVDGGAKRSLLITLHGWQSKTSGTTLLLFDLSAEVLDDEGRVLATNRLSAKEVLGVPESQQFLKPHIAVSQVIASAYVRILADLLNDKKIVSALRLAGT